MNRLLLKNGTLMDPALDLEEAGDLLIENGRISAIGRLQVEDSETVDVSGNLVTPGFIDMHVHLREPGQEDKETIETGCRAAVAGGFAAVACMPNTDPVNDNAAITTFVVKRAAEVGLARVFPIGAITRSSKGCQLSEIGAMIDAGAVAISDDGHPVANNQMMRRAMEYSLQFDVPLLDHCEDLELSAGGCMNEGPVSTELGLRGMSRAAEEMDVLRDIVLSRLTGARVHICHISTAESLAWVRQAKQEGIQVTCEVAPHHFLLTDEKVRGYETLFKMSPPLRRPSDVEAMLEGLADGTIDAVATDHAPHAEIDKDSSFEESANGIVGLETAVPLVWDRLVLPGVISESRAVELLTDGPARVLGLEGRRLEVGAVADITVIDPEAARTVEPDSFESKGRNTPFGGWSLKGWPTMTIVDGVVVWPFQ